jgi:VIT1/CCC1 family predicted Fe2+/Mn2+ transporter
MVLTYTSTLSIVTGDRAPVREMLIGALGCNLAWGIIDGGLYLLDRLNEQGRNLLTFRAVRSASTSDEARRIIEDALPPVLADALAAEQVDSMRKKLRELPEPRKRPRLTKDDWLGALGVCLLVFLCTFPVVIPFILLTDPHTALRVSNAVAIAMLFMCGYAFGRHSGVHPWAMGLSMVAFGVALVAVAIALGG